VLANQAGDDADSGVIRSENGCTGKSVSRPYAQALELSLTPLPEFNASVFSAKLSVGSIDRAGNALLWYQAQVRAYPMPRQSPASFASKKHPAHQLVLEALGDGLANR
jgi:hypothetical protein